LSPELRQSFSELFSKHLIRERPTCDADDTEVRREKAI
jgi:hypothetical protein